MTLAMSQPRRRGTTTPRDTHCPIRTCVGCRERHPQAELFRCVLVNGQVQVSRTAPGRGAWLCGIGCLETARRRRAFDRAWRTKVGDAQIERLVTELSENNQNVGGDRPQHCETEMTNEG